MKKNGQLSMALHALLHMSLESGPVASETLASCMGANAVQLRRTLAGLRRAGFVQSSKGHGGGWTIAQPLEQFTLRDIHVALGESPLLAIGHREQDTPCLVEQAVNAALGTTLRDAEAFLLERFASISLEELASDFRRRLKKAKHVHKGKAHG